ncbi:MAG TPA: NAD-dependent epimerase/dehydratase family protein [Bacteroidota bacterium]|nr:NAD-dependent epimerase/dehydratase family protein [Bacteroidota bacterium]
MAPSAFVTGGTGFIGSHLVERLLSKGYRVRCLIRNPQKPGYLSNLPVELIVGDLFSMEALEKGVAGVDFVYHVAGAVASRDKAGFYRQNREGTKNIVEAAARKNQAMRKFVFVSSGAAVGPAERNGAVDESTPYHPMTTYGKSKMEAELEVLKFKEKLPVTIVRPTAVYGPRDPATFDYFNTINKGLEPLVGFHDKRVSLVHSTDLVTGITLAGESDASVGEAYFLGSDRAYSWREIGDITKSVMGRRALRIRLPEPLVYAVALTAGLFSTFSEKPSVLNFEKGRDMVQDSWTFDSSKAKRDLGYKPVVELPQGIAETVEWYRKAGWMKQ